jgi:hypothetical protein
MFHRTTVASRLCVATIAAPARAVVETRRSSRKLVIGGTLCLAALTSQSAHGQSFEFSKSTAEVWVDGGGGEAFEGEGPWEIEAAGGFWDNYAAAWGLPTSVGSYADAFGDTTLDGQVQVLSYFTVTSDVTATAEWSVFTSGPFGFNFGSVVITDLTDGVVLLSEDNGTGSQAIPLVAGREYTISVDFYLDNSEMYAWLDLPAVFGDLDGDGMVGPPDLAILLDAWGSNPGHVADLNNDDVVDVRDLLLLLSAW